MESKEKISIKHFAGIEELEMDIKPINILIGPQGVGKSVVVKLIYFFRDVIEELVKVGKPFETNKSYVLNSFNAIFEIESNLDNLTEIIYDRIDEVYIKISMNSDGDVDVDISSKFLDYLSTVDENRIKSTKLDVTLEEIIKRNHELKVLRKKKYEEQFSDIILEQLFVPAGRSFFSSIDKDIYSYIDYASSRLDYFLIRFGKIYQYLGTINESYSESSKNNFNILVESIIGGEFVVERDDKEYIVHRDSRKIELRNVSSGQQEAVPLLLILKAIYRKRLAKEGSRLYIEEPEAHLFPTAQKAIVELLAKTYNSNPNNTQLFITTHSPYILTSFNNLIYAGNIIKQDESKRDAVEKIVDKDTILDCSQIGAYAVTKEGIKDLIDQENHIINAELLDEVSNMIGREFDQLLDIEYAE